MSITRNPVARPFGELSRKIRDHRALAAERLEHDTAMRDRGIAADHASAIARATSRGEPGCTFCS